MTKFCVKCGNKILNGDTDFFCSHCGACLKKVIKPEEPRAVIGPSSTMATAKSPRLTPKIQEIQQYAEKALSDAPDAKVVIQIVDKCGSCSSSPQVTKDRSASVPHNGSPRPMMGKPRSISTGQMACPQSVGQRVEEVVKQGWLNKQSVITGWKRRWFKLHRGLLLYFDKPEDDKARGSMPVSSCTVEVLDHQKACCFRVTVGYLKDGKTHTMQADNMEEMEGWVEALIERGAKMYDPKMLEWNADASSRLLPGVSDAAKEGPSTSPTASPRFQTRHSNPTPSNKQPMLSEATRSKSGNSLSSLLGFKKKESPRVEKRIVANPIKGSKSAESIFTNPFGSKEQMPPPQEEHHVISAPVLVTKPNPIQLGFPVIPVAKSGSAPTIPAIQSLTTPNKVASAPSTPATRPKPPPPPPRELCFSPSPKTRAVKKGNEFTCEVCGYKSGSFLNFCGACGSRLENLIV